MPASDDENKTKRQLLTELEALRRQLAESTNEAAAVTDGASSQPAFARPITRRTALSKWVAPVILSIPLTAMIRPRTAQAQATMSPTVPPTAFPTLVPTAFPTLVPTAFPTSMPTFAFPTMATPKPTDPVPALTPLGLGATAVALAGVGAARLLGGGKGGAAANDEKPNRSDDDSQDEGGTK